MTETRQGRGGRVVLLTILGLLVLVGGGYAVAYAFAADRIPRGTSVAGIELGGRTPAEARDVLARAFAERDSVTATIGGSTEKLTAEQLGMSVDLDATLAEAGGGRSWEPRRIWNYYSGGEDLQPVVDVDDAAFGKAIDALDARHGRKAREGDLRFTGGKVTRVPGQSGTGVDRAAARKVLEAALVSGEPATVTLSAVQPEITAADVEAAVEKFGRAAVAGPVTLLFSNTPVTFQPEAFAPALAASPRDGKLVLVLDDRKLASIVESRLGEAGKPVDADVKLVNGVPTVTPSKPGVGYKRADLRAALLDAIGHSVGRRTAKVKAAVAQPEVSTAQARAWKIKEKVSTFTTYYPHTDYRNINIPRALSLINGTVLAPGETFSLNGTVGERTASNGFVKGFVIDGGEITTAYGGGVSQVATTTFNAAFFAGLKDIEHKPHSLYFSRYPVGREATVAWPSVDLKFQNDTPYGVLIETHVQHSSPGRSGVVTVSMWSTKHWDIDTSTGERYNIGTPGHRVNTSADCEPQEANTGFDIDIWRIFRHHGSSEVVRREKMHTHYNTADTVTCKAPSPFPTPSPSPTH